VLRSKGKQGLQALELWLIASSILDGKHVDVLDGKHVCNAPCSTYAGKPNTQAGLQPVTQAELEALLAKVAAIAESVGLR
jgi:hypothetical protein